VGDKDGLHKAIMTGIIIFVVGSLVVYLVKFRIENERWPLQQKVRILCESTLEKDTYEIPYHYSQINKEIPFKIKWAVGKSLELEIKVLPPENSPKMPSPIEIKERDQYVGSKSLGFPLNDVAGKYLGFRRTDTGKRKSFEIVVDIDGSHYRKKVNIIHVPWNHTTEVSAPLIYTDGISSCTTKIKNNGAEGDFIVVYEVYEIINGRQGDLTGERIGATEEGKNKIHIGKGEDVQLKPQVFEFNEKGEYFVKTYVVKYQKYLMDDWHFWSRDEITLEEISIKCIAEQTKFYNYSDSHKITEIKVIDSQSNLQIHERRRTQG